MLGTGTPIRKFKIIFLLLIFGISLKINAQGNLEIMPMRVVFEGDKKAKEQTILQLNQPLTREGCVRSDNAVREGGKHDIGGTVELRHRRRLVAYRSRP